jgi:hypothetical protein
MSQKRLREFDRQLRAEVRPKLSRDNFTLGDNRTFRRLVTHEGTISTQIVEFQVGREGFSGKFTVNLAVFNADFTSEPLPVSKTEPHSFDCRSDLVQRLGFFRAPHLTLLDRLLRRKPIASDYWWTQHENAQFMRREMADVERLLFTQGLTWLGTHTSLSAFRWAVRQQELRKAWIVAFGSANPPPGIEPEPFPYSPQDSA